MRMIENCRRGIFAWIGIALVSLPLTAGADVPSAQQPEVAYLLEFIRSSTCLFIRNGRQYGGPRAYRHVLRKYDYFRDEILNTEDFIELSASVSTVSGEPYRYHCDGGTEELARDVLLRALAEYRLAG